MNPRRRRHQRIRRKRNRLHSEIAALIKTLDRSEAFLGIDLASDPDDESFGIIATGTFSNLIDAKPITIDDVREACERVIAPPPEPSRPIWFSPLPPRFEPIPDPFDGPIRWRLR